MIELKYEKTFPACAVSHIDLLRVMIRLLYRSQTKVEFSQGFNPHMLLFFSPPLTVGVESLCEYMTVATDYDANLIERLNSVSPKGIKFCQIFEVPKKPNLAGVATSADYLVQAKNIGNINLKQFDSEDFVIQYDNKGQLETKDVKKMIYSVKRISDDKLSFCIACGNTNLRIDRLVRFLCKQNGIDFENCLMQKTALYVGQQNADQYLKNIK